MRWIERSRVGVLLLLLASACTIGRTYVGSEIREEPAERIHVGRTTRADVLQIFGPPDRILRQASGDVFVYRFDQTNKSTFTIEEPLLTDLLIFSWTKVQKKSDRLTVFFDREGVVTAFGHRRGTQELEPL